MLRRGLFRLWVVATVLWDGFFLVLLANEPGMKFLDILPLLVTPPLVILAIGWMFVWAFRGFVSDRK